MKRKKKKSGRPLLACAVGCVALMMQGCEQLATGNLPAMPQVDMADGSMVDGNSSKPDGSQ